MSSTPRNRFKDALTRNEVQLGLWLGLADPYAAELAATSGYDWLLVDSEHAPNDLRTILGSLQAIAAYPAHPVVRVPDVNTTRIKQVMELGATTLLVPMVESADEARELVRAMRYPPEGIRGVGSGLARSSRWNALPSYLRDANDRACLLVQVETLTALQRVTEIAEVPGVDGVFIGPADLAASLGHLGEPAHADVRLLIAVGIERIIAAGKPPGILCTDEKLAHEYVSMGARFVAIGVDTTLLANSARALVTRFRSGSDTAPSRAAAGY